MWHVVPADYHVYVLAGLGFLTFVLLLLAQLSSRWVRQFFLQKKKEDKSPLTCLDNKKNTNKQTLNKTFDFFIPIRRRPTLTRRQKRALNENRDYVQKYVKGKKVKRDTFCQNYLQIFLKRSSYSSTRNWPWKLGWAKSVSTLPINWTLIFPDNLRLVSIMFSSCSKLYIRNICSKALQSTTCNDCYFNQPLPAIIDHNHSF